MPDTRRFPSRSLHAGALVLAILATAAFWPADARAAETQEYPRAGLVMTRSVAAHARPASSSRTLMVFRQFRSDFRPTTLLVVGERRGAAGTRWLQISLPMRPNGRTGWVRAASVQTRRLTSSIVVDLSARRLHVLEHGRTRFSTRVAIGRPGLETPTGRFYVTATFKPKERFLGSHAFETSAYSKLSEWPGGGVVGLHGTTQPSLLGRRVSHGCVRMSNAAALVLKHLTPAGTPLTIVR